MFVRHYPGAEWKVIMRIDSSTMALSSGSSQTTVSKSSEQLNVRVGTTNQNDQKLLKINVDTIKKTDLQDISTCDLPDKDAMEVQLLSKMIEALTGKKIHFYIPQSQKNRDSEDGKTYLPTFKNGSGNSPSLNWGISYQKQEYFREEAQMSFSALGAVKTADGRTIDISLDLNLSRSFTSTSVTSFTAGTAVDPLVVNYNGSSAELTAKKFSFDLDNDGNNENISFVKQGSGFLVFDKNADGVINNGSEMFGPSTGSGFLELQSYDEDGNNWIDENDSIYDRLQIWTKDEKGNDKLFAIGQVGIGAIYLGGISSNYELKDSSNTLQGAIRETSVFLREDATAGTIQHIDLCV